MDMNKLALIGAERTGYAFGQIQGLTGIAYVLLGFALIGGLGVILVSQFADMAATNNWTEAATFLDYVVAAYGTIGNFLGIVVLALVIVLIVGVVQGFRQ